MSQEAKTNVPSQQIVPEDTVLCLEEDSTDELYVLLEGRIEVHKQGRLLRTVDETGTILGEMAGLLGHRRSATLRTATECKIIVIEGAQLEALLGARPNLAYRMCVSLAKRLADITERYASQRNELEWQKRKTRRVTRAQVQMTPPTGSRPAVDPSPTSPNSLTAPGPAPPGRTSLPSGRKPLDLDALTATTLHEAILRDYHRRVGCQVRPEDLADRLDTGDERMDSLLGEFYAAGLIDRRAEGDFWRLLDRDRWEKIEDWTKQG